MSLNIQDAQAAAAAVSPVQPVPLSERVQAYRPQARPQEAFEATLADVSPVALELPPSPDDAAAAVALAAMARREDGDRGTAGATTSAAPLAGVVPTVTLPAPISMLDTPAPRARPRIAAHPASPPVVAGVAPGSSSASGPSVSNAATLAPLPLPLPTSTPTPAASPAPAAPAAPTVPAANAAVATAPVAPAPAAHGEAAPAAMEASRPTLPPQRTSAAAPAHASVISSAPTVRSHAASTPMQSAGAKPGHAGPAPAPSPSDDTPSRGDAAAAPVAITTPVPTSPQSDTGTDTQSLADARRADANVGTRQQVRAVRQAEALQANMIQRAEAASQIQVSFSSWGTGHSVTARLDGGRLHMQPSSARVGQALSAAAAPAGVELQIAVDSTDTATDERRQRRGDQGQA